MLVMVHLFAPNLTLTFNLTLIYIFVTQYLVYNIENNVL